MPQTRYVLRKALAQGLKPVVVINKMDRPEARPGVVLDAVFDLFGTLGAADEQLDFPVIYCSGRLGWSSLNEEEVGTNLTPLFELILSEVQPKHGDPQDPLQLQVSTLDYSDYLGRIAIGRIQGGTIERGMARGLLPPRRLGGPLPRDEADGLHGARAHRPHARRGGGDRGAGRRGSGHRGRDDLRGRAAAAAAADPHRRAHGLDALRHQHLPLRRDRGALRHQPPAARAPGQGARAQRRTAPRAHRAQGLLAHARPGHAAPQRAAGEDAARGLRDERGPAPGGAARRPGALRGVDHHRAQPVRGGGDREAQQALRRGQAPRGRRERRSPRWS